MASPKGIIGGEALSQINPVASFGGDRHSSEDSTTVTEERSRADAIRGRHDCLTTDEPAETHLRLPTSIRQPIRWQIRYRAGLPRRAVSRSWKRGRTHPIAIVHPAFHPLSMPGESLTDRLSIAQVVGSTEKPRQRGEGASKVSGNLRSDAAVADSPRSASP